MELVINDLIPENVPFIANIQGSGYYRVNYDDRNWRKLAEVLRTNKDWIHPLNRAQIICDVAALADIGYVSEDIKNDILSYFENETEFGPVHAYQQCIGSTDQNQIIQNETLILFRQHLTCYWNFPITHYTTTFLGL